MKSKNKKPLWMTSLVTMVTPIILMFGLVLYFAYDFKNQDSEIRNVQNSILKNIQELEFLRINLRKANNIIDVQQSISAFDLQKQELEKLDKKIILMSQGKLTIANDVTIIINELNHFKKYSNLNLSLEFENKTLTNAIERIIDILDRTNKINIQTSDSIVSTFVLKFLAISSMLFFISIMYLFYKLAIMLKDVKRISDIIIDSGNNLIDIDKVNSSTNIREINDILKDLIKNSNLIYRKNLELVEKSKLATIGETTAQIAHEIMNPLAVIVANSNKMKRVASFDKDQMADLNLKMTDRIIKIVQATKRSVYQNEEEKLKPVNLNEVIDEVKILSTMKSQQRKVKIFFEGEDNLIINCREGQVIQVMLNLINNSMDAIERLEDKWIKVRISKIQNKIEINIIDSGNGIPKKILENLFSPYFTTKEIGKGTGIGLSLSKKIINDHGGELVYNETASNTQFDIFLPLFEAKLVA